VNNTRNGLQLKLIEGVPIEERSEPIASVPEVRLSDSETETVLRRLQPIKIDADDQQDFALRDRSLPPPRAGTTIQASFPPLETVPSEPVSMGPLEVLRYSPDGDVPLASQLSATFSQPMVAVTSHDEAIAKGLPVTLKPQPPGKWRWVGTRTLLFEPEGRFPMATEYTCEIPAGTRSASGAVLGAATGWRFTTPPPAVKTSYPTGGPTLRDPLMFAEFDQRIDPIAVVEMIRVSSGDRGWNARLAASEEVESDEPVRRLATAATKDRWLAFRVADPNNATPAESLPAGSQITVTILPGTPSMEGPLKSTNSQSFSFRTYGPLRVTEQRCVGRFGWRAECSPLDQWFIYFTNPLDPESFEQDYVRSEEILPEVLTGQPISLKSEIRGNSIIIAGTKRGQTSYRVTLDPRIRDQFGQTLGETAPIIFNVGSEQPRLAGPQKQFVVMDPMAQPRLSVYSINHDSLRVRLYSVGPEHWQEFRKLQSNRDDQIARSMPGTLVLSEIVNVPESPDEIVETRIDLSPALNDGYGQVGIVVEPAVITEKGYRDSVVVWAQVTQIGLDAFVDSSELIAWATSLKDGARLEGVEVSIGRGKARSNGATTTPDGIAHLTLGDAGGRPRLLVASKGRDIAILPEDTYWWNDRTNWIKRDRGVSLRWFVFDDRKIYRPGEEVHVKGWIRRVGEGKGGDVSLLDAQGATVEYVVSDSGYNEILKGEVTINALGGFDTSFELPATMNLGFGGLYLKVSSSLGFSDSEYSHYFDVQEFRRPEFEVTAQTTQGPHFVGGNAAATVSAAYYSGGALANTPVTWGVSTSPAHFTPPNRGDFTFGKWIPWWDEPAGYCVRSTRLSRHYVEPHETAIETFNGLTDASGKHTLSIEFTSVDPPEASTVTAEASVMDVNRQAWTARTNMLVHPADLYVGIRSPRTFVQKGEPLIVQSIIADLDGKLIAGREIKIRAVLIDWVFEKGEMKQQEKNAQECTVSSATDPVQCRFETKEGGRYQVTAIIEDDLARKNQSELTLWVAGGKLVPARNVEQEVASLIPDRREYRAGDTAEVLVQTPFVPAEGLLTLRRSGIISIERFSMDGPSLTLQIPILEDYIPNVHVQVDLVGATVRTGDEGQPHEHLPERPAFARGTLNLTVPPLSRMLAVEATPRDKSLEPGGKTTIDIEVRDAEDKPVERGEITVVVVDESVLALTGYRIGNPINTFYAQRGADANDYHLRQDVLLANPEDLDPRQADSAEGGIQFDLAEFPDGSAMSERAMAMRAGAGGDDGPGMIQMREHFNALAVFAPAVQTDAIGRASVEVKLPDTLTRYRVMAVAVAGGKQFGGCESTITARLPLMVRPSAPRFLNFGDSFELPIVVQNQTGSPMDVDVAVRASNAGLTEPAGRRLTVRANDRVEVRFPVSTARAGTARFQIAGVSGRWTDAAEIELPVWTPATTEAFATYGEIDNGAIAQPVKAPSDAIKQFGGLEITTSSTEFQALTDAVLYLVAYPFECAEQLSSRILAVAALRDVLSAFQAKGLPDPHSMIAAVSRDFKRLEAMQNADGGFPFWRRGDESRPYVSIHAAHAFARALEKGFEVPTGMLERSSNFLRGIEGHISSSYDHLCRRSLVAYSLYVRNLFGDRDGPVARGLISSPGLDGLSLEALAWLLSVVSDDPSSTAQAAAIRSHLNNRATEEASTAHFVTSYGAGDYLLLHSDRRADAVILEALIKDQPESDLIPKIVRGLLAHRKHGRWENTQENAFVLLALDKYFAAYERVTPDFVSRAWLGDAYAGEHEFRGRSTDRHNVNISMRVLAETTDLQNLILSKDGPGRLYYRIGMQYAPASLKLDPSQHGFTVERIYEAVDKSDDVTRDAEGTWHIKAGARVRVKLTMLVPSRRYHVALVDPIPAGLEALNPALAVTGSIPTHAISQTTEHSWRWWGTWFEHQNMRDERVEAFASLVWEGVHTYSYVARATTPGVFGVPPTKAEEMYHPETFGRSGTDRVIVE